MFNLLEILVHLPRTLVCGGKLLLSNTSAISAQIQALICFSMASLRVEMSFPAKPQTRYISGFKFFHVSN